MGTDIHGFFEKKNKTTGKWEVITSNFQYLRDYQLFAVLADVRNGYGFAGVGYGEVVKPISQPRGFPPEYNPLNEDYNAEINDIWLGDHSHSWLLSTEILAWFNNAPKVLRTGVLSRDIYESWDHQSRPEEYALAFYGPQYITIKDNAIEKDQVPHWTHIQCEWEIDLKETLAYFFDEIQRLHDLHGECRMVFGFDS